MIIIYLTLIVILAIIALVLVMARMNEPDDRMSEENSPDTSAAAFLGINRGRVGTNHLKEISRQ